MSVLIPGVQQDPYAIPSTEQPWGGPLSFVNPSPLAGAGQTMTGSSHRAAVAAPVIGGIIAAAGALGSGAVGAASNAKQQSEINQTNENIARQQMQFQYNMSNTAYQRSRVDMERAGLNPILMAGQGGASTPQGASATMQSSRPGDSIERGAASAIDAISTGYELAKRESEVDYNKAATAAAVADAKVKDNSAMKVAVEAANAKTQGKLLGAEFRAKDVRKDVEKAHAEIDKQNAGYDNWLERIERTVGVTGSALQLINPMNYLRGSKRLPPPGQAGKTEHPSEAYKREMEFKRNYYKTGPGSKPGSSEW